MALSSGNSQGGRTMTVQPAPKSAPSGNMSILTSTQTGALSMNSLIQDYLRVTGTNYQNVYQNPDLETALMARGFSQLRPEIIGVFEFTPPITEDIHRAAESLTETTYSTNAAELFDLQCQLKQLRYAESLEFLNQQMNLSTTDVGGGIELNPNSEGGFYLDPFNIEMEAASMVLQWLTIAYNSVTRVLEAMDVKSNPHMSMVEGGNFKIYELLAQYDATAVTWAPNNLTLHEYISNELGIPDGWWDFATQTQIVAQLILDVVIRLIYPIKDYAFPQVWELPAGTSAPDVKYDPGTVLGLDFILNSNSSQLNLPLSPLKYLHLSGIKISESEDSGLAAFSKGDFDEMEHALGDAAKISMALDALASDLMVRAALESHDDILPGAGPTSTSGEILKKIYGVNPNTHNIANINPSTDPDSMIMRLMPKDLDSDTQVSRKISTFQYSSHKMPEGAYPLRTGKSYFLDEIVTSEITDVMGRLSELSTNLTNIRERLVTLTEAFNMPSTATTNQPYTSGNRMLSSSLVWDLFRVSSDCLQTNIHSIVMTPYVDSFVKICVATAAAENNDIGWLLFKYVIYKTMYRSNEPSYRAAAMQTAEELITELLTWKPGLTGEQEQRDREVVIMGDGDVSVGVVEDIGVSGAYAGMQLSDIRSITSPELLAVFDSDVDNGQDDIFDMGYAAMDIWFDRLRDSYDLSGLPVKSLSGPNLNISWLGGIALCFFWQLRIYAEAMGFYQQAGDSNAPATPVEGGGSDIALKENIELVGMSPSGINVYEFDYRYKSYGEGRYRGVMAQEVPNASFRHEDGYLWVDYAKVDVDFERIR